ncbi:MAG: hypothetical protein ACKVTZ_11585 [Bacteroidia bacterium]
MKFSQSFFKLTASLGLLSVLLFNQSCTRPTDPDPDPQGTLTISTCNGSSLPLTWEDRGVEVDYVIKCEVRITGSNQLVIKPGVKVQFDGPDAGLIITDQASVVAEGTSSQPIILEGKNPTKGSWYAVIVESNNVANKLKYVTIRHAGSKKEDIWTDEKAGLILGQYNPGKVTLENCTFELNDGYGVYAASQESQLVNFSTNVFRQNTEYPIEVFFSQLGKLDAASQYGSGNGKNYVQVNKETNYSTDLSAAVTVRKLDVPYRLFGESNLTQGVTIEPGVTMEFNTDASLKIDEASGYLSATGTSANKITFKGANAGVGAWKGIYVDNPNTNNHLEHCILDGGGSEEDIWLSVKSNLYMGQYSRGKMDFVNSASNNSGGYGIAKYNDTQGEILNNTYSGNTLGNVYTKP